MTALILAGIACLNIALFKWPDISPMSAAIVLACALLALEDTALRGTPVRRGELPLLSAAILLMLIPVSALSWLSLLLLSVVLRHNTTRIGSREAMICLGWLAVTEFGTVLLNKLRFILTPLLTLNAEMVRLTLLPFAEDIQRTGNLLRIGDHAGVILWSCTGIRSACLLVVGYRLALSLTGMSQRFRISHAITLLVISLLLNHCRVVLSAYSESNNRLLHSQTGMLVLDSLQVLALTVFILLARQRQLSGAAP